MRVKSVVANALRALSRALSRTVGRAAGPVLFIGGAAAGIMVAGVTGLLAVVGAADRGPAVPTLERTATVLTPAVDLAEARPSAAPVRRGTRPMVAIVIDDLGLSDAAFERLTRLPGPITVSILPYGDHAGDHAERARAAGWEVFLHAPMEAAAPADAGPGALQIGATSARIRTAIADQAARVPGAVGANGHMGSAFTADRGAMRVAIDAFTAEGLFFLDSRTTADTAAEAAAEDLGVPILTRDVFLDDAPDEASVREQVRELERIARTKGYAIAIGHPRAATVRALGPWLATAPARGIDIVPVMEIARYAAAPGPALAESDGLRSR